MHEKKKGQTSGKKRRDRLQGKKEGTDFREKKNRVFSTKLNLNL